MPNLLINENSPYLLQHADNPINWYPWGEEALNRAKRENKPIFLSIGYSTCYWCHRMASEAFSDEKTADFLNDNFICIKVDKEERPDIDTVYMEAATRLTENVGWPLNMFLTPDGKPFFAGTYFPAEKSEGLIDLLSLAKAVKEEYKSNNKFVLENADAIVSDMKHSDLKPQKITEDAVTNALWILKSTFDDKYGGFGEAPKFLIAQQIFFLLRYWYLYREEYSLYMVEKTLDNIAHGEVYDGKNGGFFRYAATKEWGSPHYEKMLYTNSLMTMAFLEGYEVIKKPHYKEIVEETLKYMTDVLLSCEGGFYSAEDSLAQEAEKNNEEVFIDKKISTGLNGITIACFSMVGKAFENKNYIDIAENTVNFIFNNVYEKTGKLNSYIIDGKISKQIYSSDYVYFIWGLIELYQATYNKDYLDKALLLNKELIHYFWDEDNFGMFLYPKESDELIINPKEVYDGAIPSVNAICEMNFYRLSRLSSNYELSVMARHILDSLGEMINKVPTDYLYHLCSFFYGRTPKEIIVSKEKKDILDVLNGEFRPFTLEVME